MKKLFIIGALFLAACAGEQGHQDEHGHDDHGQDGQEEHGHDEGEVGSEVHLLDYQMRVMNIRMGKLTQLPLRSTIRSNGKLELPPENQADVSAIFGGRVTRVFVLPGDEVSKGQTLAYVEHPKYVEMQKDYHRYKSELTFAQSELDRKQSLFTDSIAAQRVVEQIKSQVDYLQAEVSSIYQTLEMTGLSRAQIESTSIERTIPVKAPIGGYIRSVNIKMGQLVADDYVMASIVDNDHIHIDLRVYEQDVDKVAIGQEVLFTLRANPDSVHSAKIFAVGQAFEDDPMAVMVHADLDNDDHNLRPGMYVDARIVMDKELVMAVPDEAIIEEAGLSYVYVLQPKTEEAHDHGKAHDHDAEAEHGHQHHEANEFVFKKVEVNTGVRDMGFVEVVFAEEVENNPTIAIEGAYYLDAELNKSANGHDHHH